jgi:hypothetical protein
VQLLAKEYEPKGVVFAFVSGGENEAILMDYLKHYRGAVLVTSHDRAFLNNVVNLLSRREPVGLASEALSILIRDLGSRNGTFVSGRLVDRDTPLRNGDSITLGATSCIFISEGAADEVFETVDRTGTVLSARPVSGMRQDRFLPESEVKDQRVLRSDYESSGSGTSCSGISGTSWTWVSCSLSPW